MSSILQRSCVQLSDTDRAIARAMHVRVTCNYLLTTDTQGPRYRKQLYGSKYIRGTAHRTEVYLEIHEGEKTTYAWILLPTKDFAGDIFKLRAVLAAKFWRYKLVSCKPILTDKTADADNPFVTDEVLEHDES